MYVIDQPRPEPSAIPGVAHATWAGSAEGLDQIKPLAADPVTGRRDSATQPRLR